MYFLLENFNNISANVNNDNENNTGIDGSNVDIAMNFEVVGVNFHGTESSNTKRAGKKNSKGWAEGNARQNTITSKRLGKRKEFENVLNGVDAGIQDEVETDDELYVYSDNDEMSVDLDDELFSTFVQEGLENELDSGGDLSNYESNDEVEAENESDSDLEDDLMGACLNIAEFSMPKGEKFRLLKGMIFGNVETFRRVLYEYKIQWGFPLIFDKNEKSRVTAHCGNQGCDWRVHASPAPDKMTYMVKTCTPDHTCVMSEKIVASAKWIARKIIDLLRADSTVKPELLRHELAKYGVFPTDMQLYRAKQKAQDIIDGSHGDSYSLLPKYCVMIMNTNPGSIAKIQFEMTLGSAVPSVKRMFVGLDALKKGFFGGCLPFIGFDGCHLKGPYGGVLLSAIGLDGNNGLYPIAYSIVESENKES